MERRARTASRALISRSRRNRHLLATVNRNMLGQALLPFAERMSASRSVGFVPDRRADQPGDNLVVGLAGQADCVDGRGNIMVDEHIE